MNTPELAPVEASVRISAKATIQHLCPFMQEVDNGSVTITWDTDGWTLELHSLRAYLNTFSDREIAHEELTEEIRAELNSRHGIKNVEVQSHWRTASMEVQCFTSPTLAGLP